MRILLHYMFAALILSFYGGEVCPVLEGLPPGTLGAYTSVGFSLVFIFRLFIIKKIVDSFALIDQAEKQFFIEYALILITGVVIVVFNFVLSGVPFVNGIVFFIGFVSFGFFIAVDLSLEKERKAIRKAIENSDSIVIPRKFYPLTRKFFIMVLVTNLLVMVIIMLIIARDLAWLASTDATSLNLMMDMATKTIFKEISFVILTLLILVINILYSYSKNLKMLFQTETNVLEAVTGGDLSKLVPVVTRDEFGVIATNTNKMIHGLRDRIRILTQLDIAKEVQKNLLPSKAPDMDKMDISGISLYCEEVGGDYYDYYDLGENKIGIALTDSSGHGVGAGLHMTTIRAFFRYGVQDYKGASSLICSINKHLTRDSYESGRFTTVFFAEVDTKVKRITWIRAGHEPALFYSPATRQFDRLLGKGMALGVDVDMPIHEYEIQGWDKGAILVIYSDGLKESVNQAGEMYGDKRITRVVEKYALESAKIIEEKLIADLKNFIQDIEIEDDITIVVVKFI